MAVLLFLLKLSLLLAVFVNSENNVNDLAAFRYQPFIDHILCLRKGHNCFFYNTTTQDQQDIHDPLKMFLVEAKVLRMSLTPTKYFKPGSKDLYKHYLVPFRGLCEGGHSNIWLMKP